MAKLEERRKAIKLRKQGKSYSQIKREVDVSKSTLSLWLRNLPLSKEQIRKLRDLNEVRIEKYRQTMRRKREKRLKNYYRKQKSKWLPLSRKELFLAGLFLYWGEGNKAARNTVSINNTDPKAVRFALHWMLKGIGIPKNKIRVVLHLYSDMDVEREVDFWSKKLNIEKVKFSKPYIKESKRKSVDHKGFGHGTCGLVVHDTVIKENILMAIEAVSDFYQERAV